MGIDPGTKRIGIAITDSDRRLATPLQVVERTRDLAAHRRQIAALAAEWEVTLLVVGMPLSLDGSRGASAVAAQEEADALGDATGLPVETYDERFTTVTAERALAEAQVSGRDRRGRIDMSAAAVLLQAWLDHNSRRDAVHPDRPDTD